MTDHSSHCFEEAHDYAEKQRVALGDWCIDVDKITEAFYGKFKVFDEEIWRIKVQIIDSHARIDRYFDKIVDSLVAQKNKSRRDLEDQTEEATEYSKIKGRSYH